ncbi:MAG: nucleoside triphosphate pyrophosphohydrolase, partial [Bacteroidota bacterium]
GRFIGVAPENALRATVRKFSRRFRHIEARLSEGGQTLQDASLEEMDRHWEEAKALEAQRGQ